MRKIKSRFGGSKSYSLKILGVCFVITTAFLLSANASWPCTISGYVKFSNGTPLSGVTINFLPGTPVTTNAYGYYSKSVTTPWSGTVTPTKTGYTFSPPSRTYTNISTSQSNQNYTATLKTFTINASAGTGGSITPSGAVTVSYGDSQTFTIAANAGYHIADVLVDGASVGAASSYPFTNVTANHTIIASFTSDTFTINASAGGGGSISPSGAVVVNYGGSQTFTITPDPCYDIADVLVDGSSVGPVTSYPFTNVTANHTIAANFVIKKYTITATAGNGGNIVPSGEVVVNCGSDQTFIIAPKNIGYKILDVKVDNISQGPISSYTFTYVTDNHTIDATFIEQVVTTRSGEAVQGIKICTELPDETGCPTLVYSCDDPNKTPWDLRTFSEIVAEIGHVEWVGTGSGTLCQHVDIVTGSTPCVRRCYPSGYCYVGPSGCDSGTSAAGLSTFQTASLMAATAEQSPPPGTITTLREETIAGIEICSESTGESGCPTLIYSCKESSYPVCSCPEDLRDLFGPINFSQIAAEVGHITWVGIGPDPACPTVDIVTGSTPCVKRCYPSGFCYQGPAGCTQ